VRVPVSLTSVRPSVLKSASAWNAARGVPVSASSQRFQVDGSRSPTGFLLGGTFATKVLSPVRSAHRHIYQGDAMQAATDVKFKVGDKAVYPAQGVAEVIRIEEKDIAGSRQKFYVLRILDTDRKILVPVANAGAVGLRQVISEQEIREIFDILRERTIAFDNQTWNRRYRGFMDKIKTGSIYDVAEVLRDLYRLKTDKQLSFGERRMLDTARGLIVKEIAIARKQTEEQVRTEIEAIFVAN
jgi:CarD family transcriptional regulator